MTSIFLLFKTIIFLIVIIFLIKLSLTQLNKYNQNQTRNIDIIERFTVGKESSIAIVSVCHSYYLMSMTPQKNDILKELTEEEVREILAQKESENELKQKNQEKIISYIPHLEGYLNKRKKGDQK